MATLPRSSFPYSMANTLLWGTVYPNEWSGRLSKNSKSSTSFAFEKPSSPRTALRFSIAMLLTCDIVEKQQGVIVRGVLE